MKSSEIQRFTVLKHWELPKFEIPRIRNSKNSKVQKFEGSKVRKFVDSKILEI